MIGCGLCGAQTKTLDFFSIMTSPPSNGDGWKTEIANNNGKIELTRTKIHYSKKDIRRVKSNFLSLGRAIDEINLINYNSDTVYVFMNYYLPGAATAWLIRTNKDFVDLVKDRATEYYTRPIEKYYATVSDELKSNDYILYNAIFSWNIDLLINMIKVSGMPLSSENYMSVSRIIIKESRVVDRSEVVFVPAVRWHLE